MSNQTNPGADIVADAREWLSNHSGRVTTHGDECHRWHDACLIARLVAECERLRNAAGKYTPGVSAGSESKPARTGGAVNGPPDRRTVCGECARLVEECERLRLLSEKRDFLTPENPVNGDIVARLRDWRSVHLARLHLLMEEAADKMARVISDNNRRANLEKGLRDGIAGLQQAIRRLADQDATLSVQGGNVIVTVDATLTDEERESVLAMACHCDTRCGSEWVKLSATLRALIDRMSPLAT